MAEPIDINEARKKRGDVDYIWCCVECGCGQFWCIQNGPLVCVNCDYVAEDLTTVEIE